MPTLLRQGVRTPLRLLLCLVLFVATGLAHAQTLPQGTDIVAQLNDTVSSASAQVGQVVPLTLQQPLTVNGQVVAPAGTPLRARVTYVQQSGRFHGSGYITIRLSSIDINGQSYELHSSAIRDKGGRHTGNNITKIGGGAGIGALIGAIAGGGKGALIGTLVGGGAGTGYAAMTGKRPAELLAESVYTFRLLSPAQPQ